MINRSISQGVTLNQSPSSKAVGLGDILSLTIGLGFSREGAVAVHRLVGYIMEAEATAANSALLAKDAKACIESQLPFLKDIDVNQLYTFYKNNPHQMDVYLNVWLEMQELKYGEEHYLIPLSLWKKRANSHKLFAVTGTEQFLPRE